MNESTKSGGLFEQVQYALNGHGAIVVAYNLKSPENMGHIIRLASNFSCLKVIFVGDVNAVRESKIKKVAGAAFDQVTWCFANEESWKDLIDKDYQLIAVETGSKSQNIMKSALPQKTAFIVGNEVGGLSDELVAGCNICVHIPMTGKIKSMNVSKACAVALYEYVRQHIV